MCRIMCVYGENKQKAQSYLKAFYKAWENDPYLKKIAEHHKIQWLENKHNHGWWYILVTENMIHQYTNGDFFVEDVHGRKNLDTIVSELSWKFLLMIELRVTDIWYVSAFNSHPFHFISRNGYEWYLFHNGFIDYKKLAQSEKLDFDDYFTKNGTTLMWISISRALESWLSMKQAIERPKVALQSAYNLMMFYRDNKGKYKAFVHAYLLDELCNNPCSFEHNKLLKKDDGDLFFIWSSAVELYKPDTYEIMINGEIQEFDMDFIEEYYFDGYK